MKIVALGDSHSIFYSQSKSYNINISKIFEMWLGYNTQLPITWYRFINEDMDIYNIGTIIANNSSNIKVQKIYIENNIKLGDYVLFSYGWNDIQKNIKKYASFNYEKELNKLICNYIEKIIIYKNNYKIIPIIQSIHPNPLNINDSINGTTEERLNYTLYANKCLKAMCEKHFLLFFDIYDLISDNKGFIIKNYSTDGIHLNYDDKNIHNIIDNKLADLIKQDTLKEFQNERFGFIIPVCIKDNDRKTLFLECLKSIRTFYKDNYIILIDDGEWDLNKIDEIKTINNIHIVKSLYKGGGEFQCCYELIKTDKFDKAIFFKDGMILKKAFNTNNINLKWLWHFTNHRVHWDIIKEPVSEFNKINNIVTHTDIIKYHINNTYTSNSEFQKFALNYLKNKEKWVGCCGGMCVIDKKTINLIENKVKFIDNFNKSTSRRERMVNETIFSLLCYYCLPEILFEDSYEGLYYDGSPNFKVKGNGKPSGILNFKLNREGEIFKVVCGNR